MPVAAERTAACCSLASILIKIWPPPTALPETVLIDLMMPPTRGERVTDFRDSKRAIYSLSSRTRSDVALPTSTSGGGNPPACPFEAEEHETVSAIGIKRINEHIDLLKSATDLSLI